jgi:hypothetical protein
LVMAAGHTQLQLVIAESLTQQRGDHLPFLL